MNLSFPKRLGLALILAGLCLHVTTAAAASASRLPDAPLPSAADPAAPDGGIELNPGRITVPRLTTAPQLADFLGRSLRGSARHMLRINTFVQRYPEDGNPPDEPTTGFLGYTHEFLFLAFVCNDRDPHLIRAHMLARDSLSDDDYVRVMLDTFHDQRRAFVFETNALGIQADALYSEQSGYDFSFDTVWDTWGRRTRTGYVVLMRIPFSSLYFAKTEGGEARTWGIILERYVAHTQEQDFWPRSRHDIAGRLTQDMEIEGFRDIKGEKNIQLQPYAIARNLRQLNTVDKENPHFVHKGLQAYSGLDAKFILHNSLILDTTVNPDFSQVGIDNPAVPNQRFPPFFDEVRPFFIENSSFFMTPINLYYTNHIRKPQYGARLTGKLGPWALGLLGVDDRSPGQAVTQENPEFGTRAHFWVGRLNRDLNSFSNLGIIYADREYPGSYNRAGGVDYRMRLGDRWTVTGQGLTSETENLSNSTSGEQKCQSRALSCSGQAWTQQLSYSDLHWSWWTAYGDTSAGFVTDTGFFRRPDIREPNGYLGYTFRPKDSLILSHGPGLYVERIWDHSGLPLDDYVNPSYSISFRHSTNLSAYMDLGEDRLRPIDYSALTGDVDWHNHSAGFRFHSAPTAYLAMSGGYHQGTVINFAPPADQGPAPVDLASPSMSLEVKPVGGLDLQTSYVYSHFTQPDTGQDVYENHELISRWNYQLTKAASVNLIGQYISTLPHEDLTDLANSKTLFADALFTYMPHPGTALYVGYIGNFANLDRSLCTREADGNCNLQDPILPTDSSMMNDGKTIYVKVSYLLRF